MRTQYCGFINNLFLKKFVNIYGWVSNIRNHGKIIFMDLRDIKGIVQIVFSIKNYHIFQKAKLIKNEFCINVLGYVKNRLKKYINKKIFSGNIEIIVYDLNILNSSISLPFELNEKKIIEKKRLKYRYLDLRRKNMQKIILLRHKIILEIRNFLNKYNFLEIETPFLTKDSKEGSRNYLIFSRLNLNKFYALPQSPQLFKQLLMISCFDRYYQIVKCFRDEDLRSDRQPEFTQIDCEISFLNEIEILKFFENMIRIILKKVLNINLFNPFPIIDYKTSIKKYRTDKPDLRIKLNFNEFTKFFIFLIKKKYFLLNILNKIKLNNFCFLILRIPNGIKINNKKINYYKNFLFKNNLFNFIWIKIKKNIFNIYNIYSIFYKLINNFFIKKFFKKIKPKNNELIFLIIEDKIIINKKIFLLRKKIGLSNFSKKNNLFIKKIFPIWIIKFPMFKYNKNKLTSVNHAFTQPENNYKYLIKNNLIKIVSKSYDLILNGYEIGSGSIRINKYKLQKKIFNILNINNKEFNFLLKALKFGAPPHGGIAFGLDRLLLIITKSKSIKNVIAFPKNKKAKCLLTNTPSIIK